MKSGSFHASSRAVNALGAGVPVSDANEAKRAGIWVVSVAGSDLSAALAELKARELEWTGRVLLILDSTAESCVGGGLSAARRGSCHVCANRSRMPRAISWKGTPMPCVSPEASLRIPSPTRDRNQKGRQDDISLPAPRRPRKTYCPTSQKRWSVFSQRGLTTPESKSLAEDLLSGALRSYFRAGSRAIK